MIGKLIHKLMNGCAFDALAVRRELLKQAAGNAELAKKLLVLGIKQAIRNYYRKNRVKALRGGAHAVVRGSDEEEFYKGERRAFWSLYCIVGGMPLMRATAADLRESIESRSTQAETNTRRAEFEEAVLERYFHGATDTATVKKLTTNAKVRKLAMEYEVIENVVPPHKGGGKGAHAH